MKSEATIIKVYELTSKAGNKYYSLWVQINGMNIPCKIIAFPEEGRKPVEGAKCVVYIDVDKYVNAIVRVRY